MIFLSPLEFNRFGSEVGITYVKGIRFSVHVIRQERNRTVASSPGGGLAVPLSVGICDRPEACDSIEADLQRLQRKFCEVPFVFGTGFTEG